MAKKKKQPRRKAAPQKNEPDQQPSTVDLLADLMMLYSLASYWGPNGLECEEPADIEGKTMLTEYKIGFAQALRDGTLEKIRWKLIWDLDQSGFDAPEEWRTISLSSLSPKSHLHKDDRKVLSKVSFSIQAAMMRFAARAAAGTPITDAQVRQLELGESSSPRLEADIPTIDDEDERILRAMLKAHPLRLTQEALEESARVARRTISERLKRLRAYKLAESPVGEKSGTTITPLGKTLLAKIDAAKLAQ